MEEITIKAYECSYCGKLYIEAQKCRNHEVDQCMDEYSPHITKLKKDTNISRQSIDIRPAM